MMQLILTFSEFALYRYIIQSTLITQGVSLLHTLSSKQFLRLSESFPFFPIISLQLVSQFLHATKAQKHVQRPNRKHHPSCQLHEYSQPGNMEFVLLVSYCILYTFTVGFFQSRLIEKEKTGYEMLIASLVIKILFGDENSPLQGTSTQIHAKSSFARFGSLSKKVSVRRIPPEQRQCKRWKCKT